MNEMTQVLGTVAMEPKGDYDASTYYEKLNTVLYNDSTYMAKESVQGETPSTSSKWQLIGGGVRREDIVDNLDSNDATKMLSAKQGNNLNKNKVEVFDTVALMKSANLKNGMVTETLGYYSVNDGGNAIYKIRNIANSETADEMFVISLTNNLVAELIYSDNVNTIQLGIKNDGTTDVTTKIQNAINKCDTLKLKFIFLNGSYLITDTINLKSRIKIEGISYNDTIIINNSNDYCFKQSGDSTGIVIKNLKIENGSGILFTDGRSTKSLLENITMLNVANGLNYNCGSGYNLNKNISIRSSEDGIIIGKNVNTSLTNVSPNYIYFDNCYCETESGSTYSGIEIDYAEYIFINNCDFVNYANGLYINNTSHGVTNINCNSTTFFNDSKSIYINNTQALRSINFTDCDFIVKDYLLYKTSTQYARQVKFLNCFGSNTSGTEPSSNIIDIDYIQNLQFTNYGDYFIQTKKHISLGSHVTYNYPESYVTDNSDNKIDNKVTVTTGTTFRVQSIGNPLPLRYPGVITSDCSYNITFNNDYKFYAVYIAPNSSSGTAYII